MSNHRYVCWLDLETAGTDPDTDPILEVGMVLCANEPGLPMVARLTTLIRQSEEFWRTFGSLSPTVREMHDENGLWTDLRDPRLGASRCDDADEHLAGRLKDECGSNHVILAGSGVSHFDRRFLRAQMPQLDKRFTYFAWDVGVVRRFLETVPSKVHLVAERPRPKHKVHRALPDAMDHREEWLWYANHLEEM